MNYNVYLSMLRAALKVPPSCFRYHGCSCVLPSYLARERTPDHNTWQHRTRAHPGRIKSPRRPCCAVLHGCVSVVTHSASIQTACKPLLQAREPGRAKLVYDAIENDGKRVNEVTSCMFIHGMLKGPRKRTDDWLPLALEIWRSLKDQAIRRKVPMPSGTLNTGLHVLCRAGLMTEADAVFRKVQNPSIQHYNMLVRGYGRASDAKAAIAVLEKMALRGIQPSTESFNAAVASLCEAADMQVRA